MLEIVVVERYRITATKVCTRCGTKPVLQFRLTKGYRASQCRACEAKRLKAYRHSEKGLAWLRLQDRRSNERLKRRLLAELGVEGCTCGESHIACLEFHHSKGSVKVACVATMIRSSKYTVQEIIAEARKCVVLCANCHRKLHYVPVTSPTDNHQWPPNRR